MTTKVKLFLSMKNEAVARPLGVRRMRRAPGPGQSFDIALDGRSVRARITSSSNHEDGASALSVPNVYAEEI